jgi:hypothetical protein
MSDEPGSARSGARVSSGQSARMWSSMLRARSPAESAAAAGGRANCARTKARSESGPAMRASA